VRRSQSPSSRGLLKGPAFASALLLLVVLALAGCGGDGSSEAKGSVGGTLPACAQAGQPVSLPAELSGVPLPDGSVIDSTRKDAAGNTIYQGYVPGDVRGAKDYFETELPKAGYEIGEGDSEDHEAEMEFDGNGVEARLKVHDISGCDGALTVALAQKGEN
jgi:hypothetical protein